MLMDTTEKLETQALEIVSSILKQRLHAKRVTAHQTVAYLSVMVDDNKHRPICRLYLKKPRKYIGTISSRKVETKNRIEKPADIWRFSKELIATIAGYGM